MYSSRYFPRRYFPRSYWPLGSGAVVVPEDATVHLAGSLYIEPWIAAGLWVNARDTSSGGSAIWTPSGNVALLIDALAQPPGSQTVVATIGPNGTLGATSAVEPGDPVLGFSAWELDLDTVLHWVEGTLDDAFEDAGGFSFVAAGNFINPTHSPLIIDKERRSVSLGPLKYGVTWNASASGTFLRVNSNGSPNDYEIRSSTFAVPHWIVGASYDPTQSRGDRITLWASGVAAAMNNALVLGADGPVDVAGIHMEIGQGTPRLHWLLFQTGIMSAAEHLAIYQYLTQRGWGQQESPMSGVSRQPANARLIPPDTDNRVVLDELHNSATGAWTNGATVTATLYDSSGSEVAGSSITLTYVAGSNGKYVGTLPYTISTIKGAQYTIKAVAITAAGRRTFEETYTARGTPAAA